MAKEIGSVRIAENDYLVVDYIDGSASALARVRSRDGTDGADGAPGRSPADGADGVGIVDAEVDASGDLVISLSNNQLLVPGHVQGPIGERTAEQLRQASECTIDMQITASIADAVTQLVQPRTMILLGILAWLRV